MLSVLTFNSLIKKWHYYKLPLRRQFLLPQIKIKEKKKMQIRNKLSIAFVIFLLIASSSLIAMPNGVKAQAGVTQIGGTPADTSGLPKLGPLPSGVTPNYTIGRLAFISVSPDPIGVNQQILVNIWTTPGTHHAFYMPGYTVTLQKPDGTTVTVGPLNSYLGDCTAWFQYTVDQVGTWKAKFAADGTYIPKGSYVDRPGVAGSGNYIKLLAVLLAC
jgi:hypothetical protein